MSLNDYVYEDEVEPMRSSRQRYASWAVSTVGRESKAHMYRRQLGLCLCCMSKVGIGSMEIDHYVPLKDGCDPLDESNMYVICRPCNRKKGARKAAYKVQVAESNVAITC